ncbi:sugar isomerase [Archaeoglobales archaeon]|nr:MAG: sugar isomerase [Archaeoglobales archaeon]
MEFGEVVVNQSREVVKFLNILPDVLERQKEKLNEFLEVIKSGKAIHVFGVGRSGAVALCFAIRLKHFEKTFKHKVWWVGDEVREKIEENDVLIVFSGSGETAEVLVVAERAKAANAKIVAITSFENSSLAGLADLIILIPGGLEKGRGWRYLEAQFTPKAFYGGGEFELLSYVFQEILIGAIGEYMSIPKEIVIKEHERDSAEL